MFIRSALAGAAKGCATLVFTLARFLVDLLRSRRALVAENQFLRLELAHYVARNVKPRRPSDQQRWCMAFLGRFFPRRAALVIVTPETFLRWHRNAWRLLWRFKSRGGRPSIPREVQGLIRRMYKENGWGEERIAAELLTKLGIHLSPRTVRKYLKSVPGGRHRATRGHDQRWSTFIKNHANTTVACDFCTAVTAGLRVVYVFVVMEIGTRRLLHVNVTAHPTASWTLQQLREALPGHHRYRFLLHDRDSIYSHGLDQSAAALGVRVLRTPIRAPRANAFAERLIGTLRRELLDHLIPLGEAHLRRLLREWQRYYNQARPHSALGPGFAEPTPSLPAPPQPHRHRLPAGKKVVAHPVLGSLHHDYRLERAA